MSNSNTFVRSLHDLGAAAWFGGSLMGAVGVNGMSQDVTDPSDRARVASLGWARWTPVSAAAVGAHLLGGLGLVVANRDRLAHQDGASSNAVTKGALTLAAMAVTAYSGVLGAQVLAAGEVQAEGGTKPTAATPKAVAGKLQQLRVLQWVQPVLVGAVIVLGAQSGEQQRPAQVAQGVAARAARQLRS